MTLTRCSGRDFCLRKTTSCLAVLRLLAVEFLDPRRLAHPTLRRGNATAYQRWNVAGFGGTKSFNATSKRCGAQCPYTELRRRMVNHLEGVNNELQEGHESPNTGQCLGFRVLFIRLLEASGRNSVTIKRVVEPHGPVVVCARQPFELWRDARAQDREYGNSKPSHQSTDRGKD